MLVGMVLSVAGLAVLSVAADQFVKGAARLAVVLRLTPVVVGAIVVGFGTSAPEMLVSGVAAVSGNLDIGVGNIVGSNVANISLVLGAASFVAVVPVAAGIVRKDAAMSVAAVAAFALLVQGELHRWEGGVLLALLGAWFVVVLRGAQADRDPPDLEDFSEIVGDDTPAAGVEFARTVVSLALVAASAWVLVEGAERVAGALGLSGGFVGYTLVAVGTSAPELVTAVAAARRRETELLVGNLLGSNVFNSLAVGAVIGLAGPGPVNDPAQTWGSALMAVICLASWAAMAAGNRVSRSNGVVLLGLWLASVALLQLASPAAAGQCRPAAGCLTTGTGP